MRILVVAKEAAGALAVVPGLEAAGHAVTATSDLGVGARLAAAGLADLALVDAGRSGLDAHDALGRLRAARPGLAILVLAAHDDPRARAAALDAGADDCLSPPVALAELLARVRAVARRAARRAGAGG